LLGTRDKIELENASDSSRAHRFDPIQALSEEGIMETKSMGKVVVTAIIENLEDVFDVKRGLLTDNGQRLVGTPDHGGEWGMDAY
jgi:hypothetical protein